ncbi:MAG: hypothetical protein ACJAVK_001980, partial [Akkermansiaceae bacterium]
MRDKRIAKGFYKRRLLLTDTTVSLKDPGRSKLTQLVAHHVFGNEDRDECFAVVDGEVVANEIRSDHGTTAPSLDGLLVTGLNSG